MALRNSNGLPLESEEDWCQFFTNVMKFPTTSSAQYAKYLSSECFTGDTLTKCIDDPDMKSLLKMPTGHFKELLHYIKPSDSTSTASGSNGRSGDGPISKIQCPVIKMKSTPAQYEQFIFEWKKYKAHYSLSGENAATTLFFSCSDEIREDIRNKQKQYSSTSTWTEQDLLNIIKEITTSRTSPIVHIQGFFKMTQQFDETCENYLKRLQVKASCCNFLCQNCKMSTAETRVKEKFVIGLNNKVIQTQVLRTESISPGTPLNKLLIEANMLEQTMLDQASLAKNSPTEFSSVDELNKIDPPDEVNALSRQTKSFFKNNAKVCIGCGTKEHSFSERSNKCRAWRSKCNYCGIIGHFSKVCRKKSGTNSRPSSSLKGSAAELNEMSCLFIGEISSLHLPVQVKSSSSPVLTVIDSFPDTGANICLLGPQQLKLLNINNVHLIPCNHQIAVAGGSTILATGWLNLTIVLNDKSSQQKVYFSKKAKRFFLSRQTCVELGVVPSSFPYPPQHLNEVSVLYTSRPIPKRPSVIPFTPSEENVSKLKHYLLDEFAQSSFNKDAPFPKLSTPPAHIHLKPDYIIPRPAFWPATIAENWSKEVKESIDRDVESGILTKVPFNEPTAWCARMVVVKKRDGRPRRTVDFQSLNSQCMREPVHSQSPFHTARCIPQNTWKSVLDAVDGYHSVEIDAESSKLTTFITPWGRYRYLRFPQGHCSAGDAFNGRVQEILSKIPRMVRLVDDICLYDETIEGAFWHAWDILDLCARNGIVINQSKFQFCQAEVNFAGLTVDNTGVHPSQKIMDAISKFPPPTDLAKARGFFGLVNQVQWAYANGREMAPFRALVKPNAVFSWTNELKELFEKCKKKILDQVQEGVKQYNTKRATCIQTDFCKQGIGYLLLQKYCTCPLENAPVCCKDGWKLVFAGSRFTKGAEESYAPTEGELLAVAWSLNHAHIFTKGCTNLIVSTDHKPLLGILNSKPLERIKNPRIVRLKEQTLSFDFVVQYNKGKWHRGPDSLSRSPHLNFMEILNPFTVSTEDIKPEIEIDCTLAINEINDESSISLDEVKRAIESDITMVKLQTTIQSGFPLTEHLTDPCIRNFFNTRKDLWIQEGIIMFKNRIVVPKSLRERSLKILHGAHQGVEGMRARAANSVYWPGLNAAIKHKRDNCKTCNEIAPSQPREPICFTSPSQYPFQKICIDAFELAGKHYLAIADKYSGWLIIYHVRCSPQSKHIITCLRSIFTTYGVPETLFTDGGLPFQGQEVKQFLQIWKVNHNTSSAFYPQSNGRAELAVKTAKRLLRDNTAPDGSLDTNKASQALLQYRNTPLLHLGLSPAQVLFHRSLRDGLPTHHMSLRPNQLWIIAASQREQAFARRNDGIAAKYNQSTKKLPVLQTGQDVIIQELGLGNKRWIRYGVVVDRVGRKYTIRVHGSGRVITRNRRFLKPVCLNQDLNNSEDMPVFVQQENAVVPSSSDETLSNQVNDNNPIDYVVEDDNQEETSRESQLTQPRMVTRQRQAMEEDSSTGGEALQDSVMPRTRMYTRLLPHNKAGLTE